MTEKWKGPEPYGRGSSSTSYQLPQSPSWKDRHLKESAMQWGDKIILGIFVQYWLLCLEADEPHSSAREQRPAQSAGFWAEYERWGWQCSSGGPLTVQGHLKSSEVQKLALV